MGRMSEYSLMFVRGSFCYLSFEKLHHLDSRPLDRGLLTDVLKLIQTSAGCDCMFQTAEKVILRFKMQNTK